MPSQSIPPPFQQQLTDSDSSAISDYDNFIQSLAPAPHSSTQHTDQFHIAKQLNKDITDGLSQSKVSWPPSADDLSLDACMSLVPVSLYNFIAVLIGAVEDCPPKGEHACLKAASQRKVLSFCQDIMYAQCKGGTMTPKAVALGLAVRHLTGSSHISRLLSGLGHACSYDSAMRMETALASQQLDIEDKLPRGFAKHQFTVLVYDNIDFSEETLSGAGSTHHTNGIMFQASNQSPTKSPEKVIIPRRNRSFQTVPCEIAPYYLAKKVGPSFLEKPEEINAEMTSSKSQDFTYLTMKSHLPDLPGWTPYNINLCLPLPQSVLHYLPVIEASPTELSTVRHILDCAVKKADQMDCESVMVVFDQAIYSKAQQIRWDTPVLKERLVLRLGEFHTIMCFLSVIGKRFAMSGLEDILVESETVAAGSIRGVLNGHMYNRSIRSHKLLFEALGRLQLEAFINSDICTEEEVISWKSEVTQSYSNGCQPTNLMLNFEERMQGTIHTLGNFMKLIS